LRSLIHKIHSLTKSKIPFKLRKPSKRTLIFSGFYLVLGFVIINAIFMSLYFHDNEYKYTVFSHSYIEAILPEQATNQTLSTGVVRIKDTSFEAFKKGDYVVTYNEDNQLLGTGIEFPLISEVISVNETAETLVITYDDVVSISVSQEEVIGEYQREAGFIGTYYYTNMFLRGYILLMFSHIILLSGYYFVFIYDNPQRFLSEKRRNTVPYDKKHTKH